MLNQITKVDALPFSKRTWLIVAATLGLMASILSPISILESTWISTAQAQTSTIKVNEPFARATNPGQSVGAGYLTIENTSASADKLTSASFAKSQSVQIHEMKMDGNKMLMRDIGSLVIPANGKVELKPGGYHLMLMGLTEPLKAGDTITVTLQFEKAGKVVIKMPVKMIQSSHQH